MGNELPHKKVKLIIPVLLSDFSLLNNIKPGLIRKFGNVDYETEPFPFQFTNYYDDEMEGRTFRTFLSFGPLIEVEDLVKVKKETNRIEQSIAVDGKRKVNLDPGYMELGKFVLATTKDQQHRLYIRDGIYEEITLYYRDKAWQHWDWTYPDYRSPEYKKIMDDIRAIYKEQLKQQI